jgi:2-phosphoglycerate kinase
MAGTTDVMVVMIGGPTATGKSTLGASLARRFDLNYIDLDVFYVAFREVVPREIAPPDLHEENEAYWARPVSELVGEYLRLQEYMCTAFESVVSTQVAKGRSLLLEGTWLTPQFAAAKAFRGVSADVRPLFLFESDRSEMERRRRQRAYPWMRTFADDVMRNVSAMRYEHGIEMKRRAGALGLPVLESRPFETLEQRALAALGLTNTAG